MEKEEKLPSISGEELKEAFDSVMKVFIGSEEILPSSIKIIAEGKRKNDSSNLVVSKQVFFVSNHREKFSNTEIVDLQ